MTLNSKLSRRLANVRVQLKTGKTRGPNPRCLSPEEVEDLEARRDQLQAQMVEDRRQRVVGRVNAHTTREAEQTRDAIITELQPLTSLVIGEDADSREERIKARNNQIALLVAANREDREAIRKERVAAREAKAKAKATAKAKAKAEKRRKTNSASGSTCAPTSPAHSYASDWSPSADGDEEQEHDTATRTEAAVEMSPADQRAELEDYLSRSVHEKVDRLMAEIDARRGCK